MLLNAEVSGPGAASILAVAQTAWSAIGSGPPGSIGTTGLRNASRLWGLQIMERNKHERVHLSLVSTPDARRLRGGRCPRAGAQCFYRRVGHAGFLQSLAARLEHQPQPFLLFAAEPFRTGLSCQVYLQIFFEAPFMKCSSHISESSG
jgi:hypothetical protein